MSYDTDNPNIQFSQNELVSKRIIEKLVDQSSITRDDLVYDIGSGPGVISEVVLNKGARVTAFEKDVQYFSRYRDRLIDNDRFELYIIDFLEWEFPPGQEYKVFSNIPFFNTSEIVNKLLLGENVPQDCYLIVQKEAVEKYTGTFGDTSVSPLLKPRFWIEIIHHFHRKDFQPVPSVDVVLLQAEKRMSQLIPDRFFSLYKDFIVFCREGKSHTVKQSLGRLLTYPQPKQLSRILSMDIKVDPTHLNFMQYLGMFQFF